ncbi:MAG: cytochrome c [Saprospiraceae bacterium]|nr:cytochrome c [Saprospiraceae bacterium]
MSKKNFIYLGFICSLMWWGSACSTAGGNKTGHEFMPDMVHPIGYEANFYDFYYFNRWGTEAEYKKYATPRLPVKGTIARGMVGDASSSLGMPANGSVPYYYADTEDDRVRASKDITTSPIPITEAGLASGKLLYNINCAICHGEKGDGAGYLARDGSKYPVAPANFKQDTFYHSSNGRFYHAIMFGRNLMGSYADKLSYQERWQVIQYIRSLQAKDKKLQYDETANSFNSDIPFAKWAPQPSGEAGKAMQEHEMTPKESLPKH